MRMDSRVNPRLDAWGPTMKTVAHGTFLVAAAMMLVSCGPGTPPPSQSADGTVLLRLAPAAGSKAVYESVDTLRATVEPEQLGGRGTMVETTVQELTVLKASGDLRLLKTVVESRVREKVAGTMPAEVLEIPFADRERGVGWSLIAVANVLGLTYEWFPVKDSAEVSLDSVGTGMPKSRDSIGHIELPEHPVREGDSWLATYVPPYNALPEFDFDERGTTTFRLDSLRVVDGASHAFISYEEEGWVTGSGAHPDAGAVKSRMERTTAGHVEIDLESGFVVSAWRLMQSKTTNLFDSLSQSQTVTLRWSNRTTLLPNAQEP